MNELIELGIISVTKVAIVLIVTKAIVRLWEIARHNHGK